MPQRIDCIYSLFVVAGEESCVDYFQVYLVNMQGAVS